MSKCLIIFSFPIVYLGSNQVDRFRDSFTPKVLMGLQSMIDTSAELGPEHEWDLKKEQPLSNEDEGNRLTLVLFAAAALIEIAKDIYPMKAKVSLVLIYKASTSEH